jgi:hypothetical protein
MRQSRYFFLSLLVLIFLLLAMRAYSLTEVEARHLSLRAGFGPEVDLVQTFLPLSKKRSLTYLLVVKDSIFASPGCVDSLLTPNIEVKSFSGKERQGFNQAQKACKKGLKQAYIEHLIDAEVNIALVHRMEVFWHNHFATALKKVPRVALLYDQHEIIHKQALGSFRVLLHSIVRDSAMLVYLDNNKNFKSKPNENLARELMELFTLGVNEYTEKDVKEVARALTGMSIDPRYFTPHFYPERHDYGVKNILGEKGVFGVDAVVEILLKQKQTAKNITRKLWLEFVSTEDETEIERLSDRFYKDWNIRRLVRGILMSKAFWNDAGKMTKSPLELVVGGSRMLPGMVPSKSVPVLMRRMGQDLFDPPNVKGWPSGNDWITGQTYIERIKFGELLTRGLQPQRYEMELAFICADGGPARLAALPLSVETSKYLSGGKKDMPPAGVVEPLAVSMPSKGEGKAGKNKKSGAEYEDLAECVDALADLLEQPVWQLK